jgi:hypothetical protein
MGLDILIYKNYDPSFARTSSGLCPDDGRKATTSWLCHDVGFAHTSDPDDGRFATTSWLCHDVGFAHTSDPKFALSRCHESGKDL